MIVESEDGTTDDLSCAKVEGYSRTGTQYVGQAGYGKTSAWLEEHLGVTLTDWQARFAANVLGNFEYTPREELQHRLNQRLQGKDPGLPVNTKFWRN